MKEQFDKLVSGVLVETGTRTETPIGTYYNYREVNTYGELQKSPFGDWKEFLITNGFTLHHQKANEMQDIFLTPDLLLCKVTCVREYINVMFFQSAAELHDNRDKTTKFLNNIYKRNKGDNYNG